MKKLIVLLLFFSIFDALNATNMHSQPPPKDSDCNNLNLSSDALAEVNKWESVDLGLKLIPHLSDANSNDIYWSVSTIKNMPLDKLGTNYFHIPGHLLSFEENLEGKLIQFIDLIISAYRPYRFCNNRVAVKLNIGQKKIDLIFRLSFERDGTISVETFPSSISIIALTYQGHQAITVPNFYFSRYRGKQKYYANSSERQIKLYLQPFQTLYETWETYFKGSFIQEPVTEMDVADGETVTDSDSVLPIGLLLESTFLNQALQVSIPEYVQSATGF